MSFSSSIGSISSAKTNYFGIHNQNFFTSSQGHLFIYFFFFVDLVVDYSLKNHREDLLLILEAPERELHYPLVVQ